MITKPAIDVDAAHRGIHARRTHQAHGMVDGVLGKVRELAVVNRNVRLPPRRIRSPAGTRHLGLDLRQHLLHARIVLLPNGWSLLI